MLSIVEEVVSICAAYQSGSPLKFKEEISVCLEEMYDAETRYLRLSFVFLDHDVDRVTPSFED